jgi:hypothetical protein
MAGRRRSGDHIMRTVRERKYRLQAKTTRFIPDSDSDFAHMARIFANHVARENHRFGIAAGQVEKLAAAVETYRDALYRATWTDEVGPKATRIKNDAREEAEKIVRAVARTLRAFEGLTSVDRLMLNMHERPERLKSRAVPQIAPVLCFVEATKEGKHVLEYGNDFDYASSAKPHGAARLELFVELVSVGQAAPAHPGQLSGGRLWYLGSFTTSRFEVEYPVLNDGTPALVVYWGRWADARGGVGPFSKTCVARVEGGAYALPEPMYIGNNRPQLASVSRKVEPKTFPMLEAQVTRMLDVSRQLPSVEPVAPIESVPLLNAA